MDEVVMLLGERTREILEYIVDRNIPVNFCYLTSGRWHRARAVPVELGRDFLKVRVLPWKKNSLANIKHDQLVGVSFQDEYESGHDRFIFGTQAISVVEDDDGLSLELAIPEEIEIVRNKNYLHVSIPQSLNIEVHLCHRSYPSGSGTGITAQVCQGWTGRLVNLSADSLHVSVGALKGPDFCKGQYVGVKFTPQANVTPLSFNAYIRCVAPAFDSNDMGLDMEIIGLEASPQGRMVLQRICNVIGLYRKMAQNTAASSTESALKSTDRLTC